MLSVCCLVRVACCSLFVVGCMLSGVDVVVVVVCCLWLVVRGL